MAKLFFPLVALVVSFQVLPLHGANAVRPTASPTQENVRYVGAVTCQSSMCHGGASPSRDQFTIWSRQDFHSRAYATLVTARSARMAEALGISSATESARCTTCHAPLAALPPDHLASTANATEGVSCETCHNGATDWLRSHTRPDLTHAERVQSGLRDLKSAFVRANTCVACHQVLDPALLKAGHPELIFELDGQSASEPRHWTDKDAWFGPKAWLVGQAVALSNISADLHSEYPTDLIPQQKALIWLMEQVPAAKAEQIPVDRLAAVAYWADQFARTVSERSWTFEMTQQTLTSLANTASSFADNGVPRDERELRAERLVLGLDRLFKSLHKEAAAPGSAELSSLFAAVQDRKQFNPQTFSSLLQKFANAIAPKK